MNNLICNIKLFLTIDGFLRNILNFNLEIKIE